MPLSLLAERFRYRLIGRAPEQFFESADLLDSSFADCPPVSHGDGVIEVVRDMDDYQPRLPLERSQILMQQLVRRVIER